MLWSDLISGRYTWQETAERALALIETANVPEHIVNCGPMELYDLRQPATKWDAESQRAKREAWRAKLQECDGDPDGWNRRYYRDMLVVTRTGSLLQGCALRATPGDVRAASRQ
jgi:hypothetical protein